LTSTPDVQAAAPPQRAAGDAVPAVVLDTNVVLDWLVFEDPSCHALAACIESRRWAWHVTDAMRAELASVLARAPLRDRRPGCERTLAVLDELACPSIPAALTPRMPRCRDADDQRFVDLACAIGARWLFSRDKALLELARPARTFGVEILSPQQWLLRHAQGMPQAAKTPALGP
jgi:putative PIN family toxin of toxin-antitoxin system